MALNLKLELKDNNIVLVLLRSEGYTQSRLAVVRQAFRLNNKPLCYVSLNPLKNDIFSLLSQNNERIFVIGTASEVKIGLENYICIENPSLITELNLKIKKMMCDGEIDYLIFDCISTLAANNSAHVVLRAMKDLIDSLNKTGKKAVFLALERDVELNGLAKLILLVDKVVHASGKCGENVENIKLVQVEDLQKYGYIRSMQR